MNNDDRARVAAACRLDSWRRLGPQMAAMHVPAGAGPELLLQWLDEADVRARPEALRILRELSRHQWRVHALTGPYHQSAKLGFRLAAGPRSWWLQFEPAPRLHIRRIERLPAAA